MRKVSCSQTGSKDQLVNLVQVHLKVLLFRFFEQIKVIFRYYGNFNFLHKDLLLSFFYLFKSPYKIHKAYLQKQKSENLYTYGETPLTTLDLIACECRILSKDVVMDLGCGPGRTTFWLNSFIGCKTIGIDVLPHFIQKAGQVKKRTSCRDIEFMEKDMLTLDLKKASVLYLYGTSLDDETIRSLLKSFSCLRRGTKIITVSFSLDEYCQEKLFKVEKVFKAPFPWGNADVYLNIRT